MWGSLDSSPDHHFYDYATGRAEIARTIKMRPWREREQVDRCGTWTQIRLSKMPKKKYFKERPFSFLPNGRKFL